MVGRRYLGSSLPFFLWQPFAITVEDTVIAFVLKLNPKLAQSTWPRMLGYVWTFVWFSWTTPWFIDWALHAGTGRAEAVPFSVVGPVLERLTGNGTLFPVV